MHRPQFDAEAHPDAGSPLLSDSEFERLRELVRELCGIALHPGKRRGVARRIARRLRAGGWPDCASYLDWLRSPAAPESERRELINCVTTNKTGFFREPEHFEFLSAGLFSELDQRARRGGPRQVRLWSAACASGEEPYSLAICAQERFAREGWRIEVLGTDIDTDVLQMARAGIYPSERVERLGARRIEGCFVRGAGRWSGHHKVASSVAGLVRFERLNLLAAEWDVEAGFDAIFCRNVAIYFDRPTQARVFARMHALLSERGCLVVGQAEDLRSLPELFEPLARGVYRRRAPPGERAA